MKASSQKSAQATIVERGLWFLTLAIGVAGRLMPHIPNVTPVGGASIWYGSRGGQYRYALVIAMMLISDYFLGWHTTMPYVYGSLLATTWLASRIKKANIWNVSGVTLAGSILFFVVTNFGVWASTPMYTHNLSGLIESYAMGVPFFRNSLLGDFAYVSLFFGLEAAVKYSLAVTNKLAYAQKS